MRFSFFITTFLLLISGSLAVRRPDGRHSKTPARKLHASLDRGSRASSRAHIEKNPSYRADRLSKRGGPTNKAGPAKKAVPAKGRKKANGGIKKLGKEENKPPTCVAGIKGVGWCENLPGSRPGRAGRKWCHKDYACNPDGHKCWEENGIVKCGEQTETIKVPLTN